MKEFEMKVWTKEEIRDNLIKNDNWVYRGVVAIYDKQTFDEQAVGETKHHNGVGFRVPIPNISRQYSRATVTLGVPGAHLCSRLSLKTGYL